MILKYQGCSSSITGGLVLEHIVFLTVMPNGYETIAQLSASCKYFLCNPPLSECEWESPSSFSSWLTPTEPDKSGSFYRMP